MWEGVKDGAVYEGFNDGCGGKKGRAILMSEITWKNVTEYWGKRCQNGMRNVKYWLNEVCFSVCLPL